MASFKMISPRQEAKERTDKAQLELAKVRGESHLEYAKTQLDLGNRFRAREIAEEGIYLMSCTRRYLAVREQLHDFLAAL